jgi:hypothetical protein
MPETGSNTGRGQLNPLCDEEAAADVPRSFFPPVLNPVERSRSIMNTATEYRDLPLNPLTESTTNPRRVFEDSALKELADLCS